MTTTIATGEILKTDHAGRMRTPKARREALLDEFERSALTAPKFAALAGLKYQTFATWVRQRKEERVQRPGNTSLTPAGDVRWLEAVVQKAGLTGERSVLTIHLPGQARMEIADAAQAALAAQLLRSLGSC